VALSWLLELMFSKDHEQTLTLRAVQILSRMTALPRSDVADPIKPPS
jgi:hypothetical protein